MKNISLLPMLCMYLLMSSITISLAQPHTSIHIHREADTLKIEQPPNSPYVTQIYTWEDGKWVKEYEVKESKPVWGVRTVVNGLRNSWRRTHKRFREEWEKIHPQQTGSLPEGAWASLSNNPQRKELTVSVVLETQAQVQIDILRNNGTPIAPLFKGSLPQGKHSFLWKAAEVKNGNYQIRHAVNGQVMIQRIIVRRNYVGT